MNESEMVWKNMFQQIKKKKNYFQEETQGRVLTSFAVMSLPAVSADALVHVHVIDARP